MDSTSQGWEVQPRPLSGPIPRSSSGRDRGAAAQRGYDRNKNEGDGRSDVVEENGGEATDVFARASSGSGASDDSGGFISAAAGAGVKGEGAGGGKVAGGGGGGGGGGRRSSGGGGGDFIGDRLVKKTLQLNQLAVYWNPAEDGNPCSMHLSDIPVEQAEVVIGRYEAGEGGGVIVTRGLKLVGTNLGAAVLTTAG